MQLVILFILLLHVLPVLCEHWLQQVLFSLGYRLHVLLSLVSIPILLFFPGISRRYPHTIKNFAQCHRGMEHFLVIPYSSYNSGSTLVHRRIPVSKLAHYIISSHGIHSSHHFLTSSSAAKKREEEVQQNVGIFQRFKNASKEYGKVLIGVHCVTSAVWFGMFYCVAAK